MKHGRVDNSLSTDERQAKRMTLDEDHLCCFGMLVDLSIKVSPNYVVRETPIRLETGDDSCTLLDSTNAVFGWLDSKAVQIMRVLRKEPDLQILSHGISNAARDLSRNSTNSSRRSRLSRLVPSLELHVILYGPSALAEFVGLFASRCNLYLQHPWHCDRNVPYQNPHCLAPKDGEITYTYDLRDAPNFEVVSDSEIFLNPIDLFTDSTEQEALVDAVSPQALCTNLYKHQKQALTFMIQRESGWAMNGHHKDVWKKEIETSGRAVYYNTVSGQKQIRPPKVFRGGLLTDAPGLGKSLSIIALIASTKESQGETHNHSDFLTTTLLVVPKTLIQTWTDELKRHLKPSKTIRYCVYYGKDKTKFLKELDLYSLVITTYSVVRLDWKTKMTQPENTLTLHGIKWGRIVLDEAHIIREPSKSFAKSVCALQAERRWAVTGTPIQNRLMDLFSLFKFLQCFPFDDLKIFNAHVTQKWKAESDPNSVAKLRTLVNCLSLRRPKTTIQLPPRKDETIHLNFSVQELQYYQFVRSTTLRTIDSVNGESNDSAKFINVLQWVNRLRLICNHGIPHPKVIGALEELPLPNPGWSEQEAQMRFDHLDRVGLAKCSAPDCNRDLSSTLSSETGAEHDDEPRFEESLELLCSLCYQNRSGRAGKFFKVCNHLPRRHVNAVAPTIPEREGDIPEREGDIPSKIQRLIRDLSETPDDIKSVVFSSWTKTFDKVQPQLMDIGIRCVRLDGSLSASSRASVIKVFRDNPGIKVLLATITCGGVGLDLTAASRAYIMEPQWNPMSESQALDRIHRLGQKNEVKTTRYVMRGSWEENVLKLQKRKQELADLTLSGGTFNKADLTKGRLQYLKELVG
ncbi:alpha-1,6-mannosyltransferase [Pseudocyphellaria aurata]|nr:alpha-1,6-mannosyltransferase [Pseudocyphellaria aurata]